MDAINALLDQYDARRSAEEEEQRRIAAAEAQRLQAFHRNIGACFESCLIPTLKTACANISGHGHHCEVDTEMSDDQHFRYKSVSLKMFQGEAFTSVLIFAPDDERENIRVSMLISTDNQKRCNVPLPDLNQGKVLEKVAIFLQQYLAL